MVPSIVVVPCCGITCGCEFYGAATIPKDVVGALVSKGDEVAIVPKGVGAAIVPKGVGGASIPEVI